MNLTFLCDKLNTDRGGSNHSLNLIARRLSMRDHEVTVVTMNFIHENSLPDDPPYTVVEDSVSRNSTPGKAIEIYQKCKKYDDQSDIIHVFNPALLPIVGQYRELEGDTPIVGRLNTYDSFCTNLSRMDSTCYQNCSVVKKFEHDDRPAAKKLSSVPRYVFDTHALPALANGVDRFFALSPTVADIYAEIGFDKDRIDVIPNCVDPEFKKGSDSPLQFGDDTHTVLYVGRVNQQKGVDLLIDSLEHLSNASEYRIEIVGDGSHREQLEQQVKQNGWSQQVRFHGWIEYDHLSDFYTQADLFVHPGRWPEPFGRTILEAMQCGTPTIVSDVGAPPWIIDDSTAVFERNNAHALAQKITDTVGISNSNQDDMYQHQLEQFTPESIVSEIETKYRVLIKCCVE